MVADPAKHDADTTAALAVLLLLLLQEHYALGAALAPLRQQGVLLLGSGMSFHGMSTLKQGYGKAPVPGRDPATLPGQVRLNGVLVPFVYYLSSCNGSRAGTEAFDTPLNQGYHDGKAPVPGRDPATLPGQLGYIVGLLMGMHNTLLALSLIDSLLSQMMIAPASSVKH